MWFSELFRLTSSTPQFSRFEGEAFKGFFASSSPSYISEIIRGVAGILVTCKLLKISG